MNGAARAIVDLCGESLCMNEATHNMVATEHPDIRWVKLCPSCVEKARTAAKAADVKVEFRPLAEVA